MTDLIADNWQLASYLVLGLVLALGAGWYERTRPPARIVALVAAMAALAVVGRLAFAAIPNVKPTTDIVLFAGAALGGVPGFVVGAVTALVSNVFFGQGSWTVWQMVAWGLVGVGGALFARALRGREPGRVSLAIVCGLAGAGFGAFTDLYQWSFAAEQSAGSYAAVSATSLPYNAAHVIGNVVFALLLGPTFVRALGRYKRRFEVDWAPSAVAHPTGVACVAVLAGAVAFGAQAPRASAASPAVTKATRFLERAQNADGGFGARRGGSSSQLFTGWSALGLSAGGANPRDVARRKRSVIDYVGRGGMSDVGELERTILVVRAAGLSPTSFEGRNLVSSLTRRRAANGSWSNNVAFTAFGVMAQRAGGLGGGYVRRSAGWIAAAQNGDGGFGYVPSASSDVDDTGAALQALAAAGRGGTPVRRAIAFLRAARNADGGFGQRKGSSSNAQSTAWAVQGLVAANATVGDAPIRYLIRLQRADGHIRYSASSDQTPVWVTAQALTALARKPFPLATTPRAKRKRAARRSAVAAPAPAAKPEKPAGKAKRAHRAPARESATPPPVASSDDALRADRPKPAAARAPADGGPPLPVWAIAAIVAAVLVALWLLRRRLLPRRVWIRLPRTDG